MRSHHSYGSRCFCFNLSWVVIQGHKSDAVIFAPPKKRYALQVWMHFAFQWAGTVTMLWSDTAHAVGCSSCWIVDGSFSWHWWRRVGEVSHSRSGSTTTLTSAQCRIRFSCRQAAVLLLHKYTFTYINCCNCILNGSLEVFIFLRGTRLYRKFYPA